MLWDYSQRASPLDSMLFLQSNQFFRRLQRYFFIFSLFIGQFSGECLETIKKVGIKTQPTKMYLIVKYKASIFDYL
jgi:hypothetical protein